MFLGNSTTFLRSLAPPKICPIRALNYCKAVKVRRS
jgi:hypothetical protein